MGVPECGGEGVIDILYGGEAAKEPSSGRTIRHVMRTGGVAKPVDSK